jgi:mannose-6-phosphate isomerase-like protein (cupin superfamily)
MEIKRLPAARDAVAPDGSDVRLLATVGGGSMAQFELAAGETSVAVRHRTVEELWYFTDGHGEMWRRTDAGAEVVDEVGQGVSLAIPLGTTFQFRSLGPGPLRAIGATLPPWPGAGEAVLAEGPWPPTVTPGPV